MTTTESMMPMPPAAVLADARVGDFPGPRPANQRLPPLFEAAEAKVCS